MEDLSTQEEREKFIDDFLNKARVEDEDINSPGETTEDGQQVEEEIAPMPTGLATPISVMQQKMSEQQKEKRRSKKKKKSKTAKLPEAGSELADDYVEKHAEDLIDDPFD
ncbi:MAG: hypothetical protein EXX96DRAFT_501784, partial [Benjaminiella poitrasii]